MICNKSCQIKFDETLKERFFDTFKFSNQDNNTFILLLQKVFILINIWMIGKNSMKLYYLKKKTLIVTLLYLFAHSKRVCKDLRIKHLGEHYDLYVQSDILLLADLFQNFRNMFLEMHELDRAKFISAPGLAWQAALKKAKVKLDFLTDIDVLSMVEKGIRGGIRHSIYRYVKAHNKYMKNYDKNK